jgi:GNAT superfamily N-acetyltransferase
VPPLCLTLRARVVIVGRVDSDPVARAALFPRGDISPPPSGHPDRRVVVSGVQVGLDAGEPFGFVFPERIPAAEVESVVEQVRATLRREGRSYGVWFVPEAAEPGGLAQRRQELGFRPNAEAPFEPRFASMSLAEPPPLGPTDVDSHRVRSFNEFRAAFRVAAKSFEMDPGVAATFEARAELLWPFEGDDGITAAFVATLEGEVVGAANASFGKTAVLLDGSGTHPDYRGRGIYRSMVRARWDAAVARGTPALTVGAGAMSRPILETLGFSIVGWNDCLRDDLI